MAGGSFLSRQWHLRHTRDASLRPNAATVSLWATRKEEDFGKSPFLGFPEAPKTPMRFQQQNGSCRVRLSVCLGWWEGMDLMTPEDHLSPNRLTEAATHPAGKPAL